MGWAETRVNRNLEILIAACQEAGIAYQRHHPSGNALSVTVQGKSYLFVNWSTPFNPHSVAQLCQDKDYFHSVFSDVIRMPGTLAFLDPSCEQEYQRYLVYKSIDEIVAAICEACSFPLIVKRNRGSWGVNVFKVEDVQQLERGVRQVFDRNSAAFDYVCLAQAYVPVASEYRVIYFQGRHMFSYRKVTEQAAFAGNLSPLHWHGARTELVTDQALIARLCRFCAPLFDRHMLPFCGLDIIEDTEGSLWLIEANGSPGFDRVLRGGATPQVTRLYAEMLAHLSERR
jgi:glutathione synthase/RimK-type ligase-like ATP-grasp enzyme